MKIKKDNPHGLELLNAEELELHALGPVDYQAPGLLTYATNEEFLERAEHNPDVVGIVTRRDLILNENARLPVALIADDPQAAFFRFHNWLAGTGFHGGCENLSTPWAGVESHICPMDVVIENGVIIHPGAVIGYPGTRFVYADSGERIDIVHVGGVHICKDAHIGANSVIVKSVWPRPTYIGRNAFIGSLVNVGHNVRVGDDAVILPGAVLGGSCVIGKGAIIGLGAIIRPHAKVGAGARVSMGSVVIQDVPPGVRVTGNFAIEHSRFIENLKGAA